jgi:hypothetical protein
VPDHLIFLGVYTKVYKVTISFVISVCLPVRPSAMEQLSSHRTIFIKCNIWVFFENLSRKYKLYENWTRKWVLYMKTNIHFFIISRSFLLRMRNVSDKNCRENQNTQLVFSNFFIKCAVYEIKWKNTVERGRRQMTIWNMCMACWVPKAINTHT